MASNNPFMPSTASAPMPGPGGQSAGVATSADEFAVDLTEVESSGLMPEGTYRVRCANVEQSVSKGGNPMFVWDFEVVGGDHAGRILKVFTAITPGVHWATAFRSSSSSSVSHPFFSTSSCWKKGSMA